MSRPLVRPIASGRRCVLPRFGGVEAAQAPTNVCSLLQPPDGGRPLSGDVTVAECLALSQAGGQGQARGEAGAAPIGDPIATLLVSPSSPFNSYFPPANDAPDNRSVRRCWHGGGIS